MERSDQTSVADRELAGPEGGPRTEHRRDLSLPMANVPTERGGQAPITFPLSK